MDEQYQAYLLAQIREYFYKKFDSFMIEKWSGSPLEDPIPVSQREEAYARFYQKVKRAHVANRQTIRRWFGLGTQDEETLNPPNRKSIYKIAFALGLSMEETEEYLQYGISQAGFQVNDYEEFICMYCLENGMSQEKCQKMIDFFEEKCAGKLTVEQQSKTNWLREQFQIVKEYPEEDFFVWICRHRKYFKGYSLTVLNYYHKLVEKCLVWYREEVKKSLAMELKKVGFYEWLDESRREEELVSQDIQRFVKNRCRSKTNPLSKSCARDIREMTAKVFADRDRLCDLVTGVYSTVPLRFQGRNKRGKMYKELEGEIRKSGQRVRVVQRSDLLILAQYIIYKEAAEQESLEDYEYDAQRVKDKFIHYANGILDSCGMRRVDPEYMLDYLLLSCFDEKEMYLFSEVLEE